MRPNYEMVIYWYLPNHSLLSLTNPIAFLLQSFLLLKSVFLTIQMRYMELSLDNIWHNSIRSQVSYGAIIISPSI